jgi:TetR/AcrR family transcriptional repressor of nem operon
MARTKNFDEDIVLDKAVDIFRRQGYKGTSPEELVFHLGISRSSLYSTYGDKRSLFIKALNRYRYQTTNALKNLAGSSASSYEAIKNIFQLTIDGCLDDNMPKGCFLVNSIVEFGPEDPETTGIVKESMNDNRDTLLQLIIKGQKEGEITNDLNAEALADYLVNCISGISISAKAGADRITCENITRNSIAILRNQILT